jgi:murein DD-endopeptidase MepM/ murein hydrolase activator NlpD
VKDRRPGDDTGNGKGGITLGIRIKSERNSSLGKRSRTVLILPSSPEKRVFKVSLPPAVFIILCVSIITVPFLAGAGLWSLQRYLHLSGQSHHLEVENHSYKSKVDEQSKKIQYLNEELFEIREKAGFIQRFLGLSNSAGDGGGIGKGGVELSPKAILPRLNSSTLHPFPRKTPHGLNKISLRPGELRQLNQDLDEIITSLEKRQQRLDSFPSISPVDPQESWISSSFGVRVSPFTNRKQFHPGVDIAGSKGTPIIAPAKGKVIFAGKNGSLGLSIEIQHDSSLKTIYGHLLKSEVQKGQLVQRGQVIGHMGDSGRSTGYHLHYQIEKNGKCVNPFDYMMDWQKNRLLLAGD